MCFSYIPFWNINIKIYDPSDIGILLTYIITFGKIKFWLLMWTMLRIALSFLKIYLLLIEIILQLLQWLYYTQTRKSHMYLFFKKNFLLSINSGQYFLLLVKSEKSVRKTKKKQLKSISEHQRDLVWIIRMLHTSWNKNQCRSKLKMAAGVMAAGVMAVGQFWLLRIGSKFVCLSVDLSVTYNVLSKHLLSDIQR